MSIGTGQQEGGRSCQGKEGSWFVESAFGLCEYLTNSGFFSMQNTSLLDLPSPLSLCNSLCVLYLGIITGNFLKLHITRRKINLNHIFIKRTLS